MNLQDILFGGSGITVILMTLLEVSKIPINPWSTLAKWIGRALNADLMAEIKELKNRLDEHIQTDDERNADLLRTQILRFNDELVHDTKHTKEHFDEILSIIHDYETYSEYELRNYEKDVREHISQFTDEELMEAYGLDRATLNSLIPRAAVLMRKYIDNDDGWTYHRDYAISEAISEYRRMNK